MSRTKLKKLSDQIARNPKEGVQAALGKIFEDVGCKVIGQEIQKGNRVTENATQGIHLCIHSGLGPRFNPKTNKYSPQTKKAAQQEKAFIDNINWLLDTGGFKRLPKTLISDLKKRDEKFEKMAKAMG